jgi:hypothetical protein
MINRRPSYTSSHGGTVNGVRTPEYQTWNSILTRCHGPNPEPRYGGRGISVCERWRKSFTAFLEDMGTRPPKHPIDRIDNDGNYEPGNCRWVTHKEQMQNTSTTARIEFRGVVKSYAAWAEETGIPWACISQRLKRGWTVEQALTEPPRHNGGRPIDEDEVVALYVAGGSILGIATRLKITQRRVRRILTSKGVKR